MNISSWLLKVRKDWDIGEGKKWILSREDAVNTHVCLSIQNFGFPFICLRELKITPASIQSSWCRTAERTGSSPVTVDMNTLGWLTLILYQRKHHSSEDCLEICVCIGMGESQMSVVVGCHRWVLVVVVAVTDECWWTVYRYLVSRVKAVAESSSIKNCPTFHANTLCWAILAGCFFQKCPFLNKWSSKVYICMPLLSTLSVNTKWKIHIFPYSFKLSINLYYKINIFSLAAPLAQMIYVCSSKHSYWTRIL